VTAVDCDIVDAVVKVESEIDVPLVRLTGDCERSSNSEVVMGRLVV